MGGNSIRYLAFGLNMVFLRELTPINETGLSTGAKEGVGGGGGGGVRGVRGVRTNLWRSIMED